jgi:predicted amidohydrolase
VGGVCHGGQRYVRESHVFDPLGITCATGSGDLLVCSIDPYAVTSARDAMPVLSHRRPDLYV